LQVVAEPGARYVTLLLRSFLPIGVGLFIFGVVMLVRTVQFVSRAEHATGTVVAVTEDTDSDGYLWRRTRPAAAN
jgi:hypothetical protein